MKWSENLQALGRGIRVAARVVQEKFGRAATSHPADPGQLLSIDSFGRNPGQLAMLAHIPSVTTGRPLVVLLHGCGQRAATFATDTGWIALADRIGFTLLLPQQAKANNAQRCFQWFRPDAVARGQGEAGSIASMVETAIERFGSDPKRVFVVGLSAGGAMAAALLAAYPDRFAAGAAIAALPVGAASSGLQAIRRMTSPASLSPDAWATRVTDIAPAGFAGPWPRLSVWHGEADTVVVPRNGADLVTQWSALLGLDSTPAREEIVQGATHRAWGPRSPPALESWSLPDFGHAYPVQATAAPRDRFVVPAALDATTRIASFLGL